MLDKNKNELGKGIVKVDDWYYKVFIVSDRQIIVSGGSKILKRAREQIYFCGIWIKESKQMSGIEQIEYESLGVFDSKGREYKVGDTAILSEGATITVLGAIKSINEDKLNFVYYKDDDDCDGGWNYVNVKNCTILHSALEKPVKEELESALSLLQDFLTGLEKSLEIVNKKIRESK